MKAFKRVHVTARKLAEHDPQRCAREEMRTADQLAQVYKRLGPPELANFDPSDLPAGGKCRVGAFVLADDDRQVVLIRRTPIKAHPGLEHYWWIPGGGQEGDEALDQTAQREFREETGLTVRLHRTLLATLSDDRKFIALFFLGTVTQGELSSQVDPDRITAEVRRFPPRQVPFDRLWTDQDKILLVREGFSVGDVAALIPKNGLKQRHNEAAHDTARKLADSGR